MPTKKVAVTLTAAPKKSVTKTASKKVTSASPKTAVKKATTKTKPAAKKSLVYADNSTSFWLADGQILNSLVALRDAFAVMDKTVYAAHVTTSKNDFASWVSAVLHDTACARDLKTAKTPTAAKTVIVRHLKLYTVS